MHTISYIGKFRLKNLANTGNKAFRWVAKAFAHRAKVGQQSLKKNLSNRFNWLLLFPAKEPLGLKGDANP